MSRSKKLAMGAAALCYVALIADSFALAALFALLVAAQMAEFKLTLSKQAKVQKEVLQQAESLVDFGKTDTKL